MPETFDFELNGKPVQVTADGDRKLLWVLRSDLGLTGPKLGCGSGYCGACTVLRDNAAVRSCVVPLRWARGRKIVTIEGLAPNGNLHPLQRAFIEHSAFQCGYCTPGMILRAYSLLLKNPRPTFEEIVEGMDGNLCRCSAYARIVPAIQAAAEEMRGGTK
jgi:aerobic-type carbon monoxide dehydrogenase small subunit (CoxS/CutS family)